MLTEVIESWASSCWLYGKCCSFPLRNLHQNLDFTLPNLSQENPEPTADWGKCGVPKVFKVKRGTHFCQRRYEIIRGKAHYYRAIGQQVVFLIRLIWNFDSMLEIVSWGLQQKPPAHQSKESNTCGAQGWHLDSKRSSRLWRPGIFGGQYFLAVGSHIHCC